MTDLKARVRPDWPTRLRDVLALAAKHGPAGVSVFDLDSTVFDNRPRQARIVREFGQARGIAPLRTCDVHHWASGWDMKAAMVSCGLSPQEAERLYPDAKAYWADRFFTSEYCVDDVAIPGAAAFLHQMVATGGLVAYVTGRHEAMRQGSVAAMRNCGMPVPFGTVHLLMKPTLKESDDDYKRVAHAQLETMGAVIAAFDNEPTHANDYAQRFPQAQVIHLATDHSGRPVTLLPQIVSVPHFQL